MSASHSTPPRLPDPSWRTRVDHVWVTKQSIGHERYVGVLVGWRQDRRGTWLGWVIYVDPGIPAHGGGPTVTQGWVDAGRIERLG